MRYQPVLIDLRHPQLQALLTALCRLLQQQGQLRMHILTTHVYMRTGAVAAVETAVAPEHALKPSTDGRVPAAFVEMRGGLPLRRRREMATTTTRAHGLELVVFR